MRSPVISLSRSPVCAARVNIARSLRLVHVSVLIASSSACACGLVRNVGCDLGFFLTGIAWIRAAVSRCSGALVAWKAMTDLIAASRRFRVAALLPREVSR